MESSPNLVGSRHTETVYRPLLRPREMVYTETNTKLDAKIDREMPARCYSAMFYIFFEGLL